MAARMNGRTESRRSCIVCRAHVIKLLKRRSRTRGSSNELRQRVVELRERLIESCKWIIELSTRVIAPSERFIERSEYQLMRRFRDVNSPDAHASRVRHGVREQVREGTCGIRDSFGCAHDVRWCAWLLNVPVCDLGSQRGDPWSAICAARQSARQSRESERCPAASLLRHGWPGRDACSPVWHRSSREGCRRSSSCNQSVPERHRALLVRHWIATERHHSYREREGE